MKQSLISKDVPEKVYTVVSDYIWNKTARVPLEVTGDMVDLDMSDVFIEDGNVHIPSSYRCVYRGTNNTDDTDEYEPVYGNVLTKEQVEQMIHEYPL